MDSQTIRILVVDGHPSLSADQADMEMTGEASSGIEAVREFHRNRPDFTLVDMQMPEMNGLDAGLIEL